MRTAKNIYMMFLALATLIICVLLGSVMANAETVSGQCGANASWTLDTETGVLAITGVGDTSLVKNKDWSKYTSAIKSVTVADGITSIYEGAFSGCTSLTSIDFGNGIKKIGKNAFSGCSRLDNVNFPNSLNEIDAYAFESCASLKSIIIPDSVTVLGSFAFRNCKSLETCVLSDNIEVLKSLAFNSCTNLSNVKLPSNLKEIWDNVFSNCSSLKNITFPEGLEYIGMESFVYSGLTEIVIPASVTYISDAAFAGTNDLVSIKVAEGNTQYYSISNCVIWKDYNTLTVTCKASVVPLDENIKVIHHSFDLLKGLTTVNIPKTVEMIISSFYNTTVKNMYIYSPAIAKEIVTNEMYTNLDKVTDTFVIEKSAVAEGMDTTVYTSVEEIQYYDYTYVIYSKHAHDWQKANGAGFYGDKCSVCEVMRGSDVCKDHTFELKQDASSHWQECECGEKKNISTHTWDGGKVTVQPSYSQNGERLYTCTACTQTKTESVPKLVVEDTAKNNETTKAPVTDTTAPDTETQSPVTDMTDSTTTPTDTTTSTGTTAPDITEPVTVGTQPVDSDSMADTDGTAEKKENNTAVTAIIIAAMTVLSGGIAAGVVTYKKRK